MVSLSGVDMSKLMRLLMSSKFLNRDCLVLWRLPSNFDSTAAYGFFSNLLLFTLEELMDLASTLSLVLVRFILPLGWWFCSGD